MSDYCPSDTQIQPRGISAGGWDGPLNECREAVPPKNQHKLHLPRLNPIERASTEAENGGALYEGRRLSLPQGQRRQETGFDRQLSEPLNMHRNHGVELMVDCVEAIGADGVEPEPENGSQVQSEVNCMRSEGSTGEVDQEPFRENNGLSRMEGKPFPISITDEMDTASDHDVDGTDLRQTENQYVRKGFPHELGANDAEITTEGFNQSMTPKSTPALVEESVPMVTQCRVETPQKTAELQTAGDMEDSPQRPVEHKESTKGELCLQEATAVNGQDTTTRDEEEDAVQAEVVPETDEWRVEAQAEDQMVGEEGWRSHHVQGEEVVEEEEAGEGPSERGVVLQEMLEGEKEPWLETSRKDNGSPAVGKSSTW